MKRVWKKWISLTLSLIHIYFDSMEETVIPHFKGGEREIAARMYVDGRNKIMRGRLVSGA